MSLQVRGISKRFGAVQVLSDVALDAPPGEITTLLGPNGAGKSTLFKIILGLVTADAGSATVDGRDVLGLPLHRKKDVGIGYLPQESASFPELTVEQNLRGLIELLPLDRAARAARLGELLAFTGLEPLAARPYRVLSVGEQRRLEIAKALAAKPRILLLDEPFSGLDPRIVEGLREMLRALAKQGVAVLLTDHNVHMTLALTDHAHVIVGGRVVCHGTPAEVAANATVRDAYLGKEFVPPP